MYRGRTTDAPGCHVTNPRTRMSTTSYASREHGVPESDAPPVDDEALEALSQQVRMAFSPPHPRRDFDLDRISEFLGFVTKVAAEAGIEDQDELEELLVYAARMYVARSVQDHLSSVFRLSLEPPDPPTTRAWAAFFRRFAER